MEIEVGSYYRVNHSNCPKSFPFNSIQSVLVDKKSDEEISVVYPSNKSLDKFFGVDKFSGSMQPNMDQKFVMGLNPGLNILTHKISFEEFASQRGNKSFWIYGDGDNDGDAMELGVKWETRRRTKVYTRRKAVNKAIKVNDVDVDGGDRSNVVAAMDACCDVNKKEDKKVEIEEKPTSVGKRKCRVKGVVYSEKKKKKKRKITKPTSSQKKLITDSQHRWTAERYRRAEMNLFKIMKEKETGPSNTLLRPDLRAEARKLIGDTGLLDHLLKHVAGKLAPGGKERFCRRHNPDGAMEYWLESSDLAQIRKKAGVADPFWVPPAGWKPGDCPTQDPACALQLKELREQVYNMKREIGMLSSSRGQENSQMLIADTASPEDAVERLSLEKSVKPLKEMCEELMKRKAYIEKQLLDISKSFSEMEKEVVRLKESAAPSPEATPQIPNEQDNVASDLVGVTATATTEVAEKEERGQSLKSGFRMCKPHGSFIWPSQVPCTLGSSQSRVVLAYPTPPPPPPPPPRPVIRKPVANRAGVTLSFSTATIRGSTTIESISYPTTASCSSVYNMVPDLNQAPLS